MRKPFTHLTQEERYQIYACKKAGDGNKSIAEVLNRHISTIKRELSLRNLGQKGYRPQQAHRLAQERRQWKPKMIKMTEEMQAYIRERLEQQWSPEQIQAVIAFALGFFSAKQTPQKLGPSRLPLFRAQ